MLAKNYEAGLRQESAGSAVGLGMGVLSEPLSWLDRLNLKLEAFVEVEAQAPSTLLQTSQLYVEAVEASVSAVGNNVRKMCGDFVRELLQAGGGGAAAPAPAAAPSSDAELPRKEAGGGGWPASADSERPACEGAQLQQQEEEDRAMGAPPGRALLLLDAATEAAGAGLAPKRPASTPKPFARKLGAIRAVQKKAPPSPPGPPSSPPSPGTPETVTEREARTAVDSAAATAAAAAAAETSMVVPSDSGAAVGGVLSGDLQAPRTSETACKDAPDGAPALTRPCLPSGRRSHTKGVGSSERALPAGSRSPPGVQPLRALGKLPSEEGALRDGSSNGEGSGSRLLEQRDAAAQIKEQQLQKHSASGGLPLGAPRVGPDVGAMAAAPKGSVSSMGAGVDEERRAVLEPSGSAVSGTGSGSGSGYPPRWEGEPASLETAVAKVSGKGATQSVGAGPAPVKAMTQAAQPTRSALVEEGGGLGAEDAEEDDLDMIPDMELSLELVDPSPDMAAAASAAVPRSRSHSRGPGSVWSEDEESEAQAGTWYVSEEYRLQQKIGRSESGSSLAAAAPEQENSGRDPDWFEWVLL